MIDFSKVINTFSLVFGKLNIDDDINLLNEKIHTLSYLSTEELKQKCFDRQIEIKEKSILSYLSDKIPFIQKKTNFAILDKLAIGIAAFNKCPADLTNTILYPNQIKAALSLTQSCVLQMDTGEGKTYALLPAVFALSCKHNKVYILCANEYLALRDAERTKSYWDFVGLDVQFCSKNDRHNSIKWEGDVIYTTLTALLFKAMNDDLVQVPYSRKIKFDAIIIDEIDAVLFDNDSNHAVIINIKSNSYNWKLAIDYAKHLEENVDILINLENLTASLTIIGDGKFKNFLKEKNIPISQYGQLREAIEISFVALSLEEDKDFVCYNNKIYSLDRLNGEIEYNKTKNWIIPLEIIRSLDPRPNTKTIHELNPRVFLKQFNHISGMSGTVKEDSAEYFYIYFLPIVMIEPRIKRIKGNLLDLVYKSSKEGIEAVCQKVSQAIEEQRPVLIGTQNIKNAQIIYNLCCEIFAGNNNLRINLITGKNDEKIAEIFQKGGQVGSIIIATQLAGRGVDIRLSEEARKNGGLVLIGFQRGMDMRHDNQFLGRAGRQGDPYSAQFIVTFEDQLMELFGSKRIKSTMETIGLKDGEAVQHKMLSNSIVRAQNKVRANNFLMRRVNDFKISTEDSIYHNKKNWLSQLNVSNEESLTDSFIRFVIEHFIKQNLDNLIQNNLNSEQANNIIQNISLSLNIKKEDLINPVNLEGKKRDLVNELIKDSLFNSVTNTIIQNEKTNKRNDKLWRYLKISFRNNSIKCRISRINNFSNLHYNNDFIDKEFDIIVKHLNLYAIKKENNVFNFIQINSINDIKNIYQLLHFLEKNIHNLSETKFLEAKYLINNINNCWVDSVMLFKKNNDKNISRTPYLIAYWTLISAGMNFSDFQNKFEHKLQNEDLSVLQRYRLLSDGLIAEWDKIESGLSSSILRNIFTNPTFLDELFFFKDNEVVDFSNLSHESEFGKKWDIIKKSNSIASQSNTKINNLEQKLISNFIAQFESEIGLGINFDKKALEYLLNKFLEKNPIHTLQFPDKIIKALEIWKGEEILNQVTQEMIKKKYHWIKLFLNFLNKKSIIVMPTFKHKINFVLQKVIKNIKDYKILIPITQLAFWGIFFICLSVYGDWFRSLSSNFFGFTLIDKFLCAGWLQKGIITAPIFLLYLISNHLIKENIIVKYVGSLGCSILLIFYSIQSFTISNSLLAFISCVFITLLYIKSIEIINNTEKALNISLISIWIIFCISVSLLPNLNGVQLLVFAGIVLYYSFLHKKLNHEEIVLMSSQITGSYTNLEASIYRKAVKIDGNIKSVPHIYAFIFSCLLSIIFDYFPNPYNEYNLFIIILSYLTILLLLTNEMIRKKLSFTLWEQSLNSNRQILIDKNYQDDIVELKLEDTLLMIKNKILKKEILLQIVVFVLCVLILKDYQLFDFQYPLSLAVLVFAFLFGDHILKIFKQISHLLIFSGRISNETYDFQEINEIEEDKTLIQKIKEFFNPFTKTKIFLNTLYIIIVILFTLSKIYKLLFN